MNWDAISAVGEVVGALAVVLSLLYLALQIRHSSKMAEDAAFRDVFSAVTVQFSAMTEGPNAEIILKGLVDFATLSGREKYIFDTQMACMVTLVESSFISNEAQFISDETMENWSFYLRPRYLAYPGWREWWGESKGVFIPEAQSWFDRQIDRADPSSDYWIIR
ncbi:MAG: hypothetical protein O7H40_09540 [Gammaproteobacteria bacterium]|nr:hypothetical protein [Gammaproteobacteria bacterium]